ncbi:MAG TPA: hypothetical protein VHI13_04835 [Candidatus Kapabacteria bacterium]|nr:hypothetical protein [Candidatus Kapabacteria bacterium]
MRFATLGPHGTCHENATLNYARHFGIENAEIVLFDDFGTGLELLHDRDVDYLVQNSAHLEVHLITERYFKEISVIDSFIYPTREMVLLERIDVEHPRTMALMPACEGYLDGIEYPETRLVPTKPAAALLLHAGEVDAAIVHIENYTNYPGQYRLRKYIGAVVTAWIVYGWDRTFNGKVLSTLPGEYFRNARASAARRQAVSETV